MTDKTKEFKEGYLAYHLGKASIDNPYNILVARQKWLEWKAGFLDAFASEDCKAG